VIDLKTGRPMEEISAATMENSYPREKKSVDELAAYLAYALRILKNCGLPCEGITTPGGFGNLVKQELSLAVQQSVQDVFGAEIPHYFKYVVGGSGSTEPKLEHVSGQGTDNLQLTVNVPAGTGDWFGGWQGDRQPQGERYASAGASSGRMVELIERGQPALMLCHWPGMYSNGAKTGFHQFQQVVTALHDRFGERTQWMKLSEIARYWAARELTGIRASGSGLALTAPFAAPQFTIQVARSSAAATKAVFASGDQKQPLRRVSSRAALQSGTWLADDEQAVLCVDLPKGESQISWS
jgi:hypothetical protein